MTSLIRWHIPLCGENSQFIDITREIAAAFIEAIEGAIAYHGS